MASIYPFRAALPDLSDIISFDDFFGGAKRKFPLYLADGMYSQTPEPIMMIYRIKRPHRSHTGLIACAGVEDALQNRIKKHEHTLAAKADKMLSLIEERGALIKPVLLTYPNAMPIDAYINRYTITQAPSFVIPFEDEEHIFWMLTDPEQLKIVQGLFAEHVPGAYVCDGHHRIQSCETMYLKNKAANPIHNGTEPYNYFLATYLAASEIEIHNYNRLLVSLKGHTPEAFLQKLSQYHLIAPAGRPVRPMQKHQMGLFLGKQWYSLKLRPEFEPSADTDIRQALDVTLLNRYVFQEILGIEDVRTEMEIKYLEGTKGMDELEFKVKDGKAVAGFNLYPVGLEDLIAISDLQGTLPPKSTYIEPRMRNAFLAQLYEDLY